MRALLVTGLLATALTGCAKPVKTTDVMFPRKDPVVTSSASAYAPQVLADQLLPARIFSSTSLTGRTMQVGSTAEIVLNPGEVILTFDDGPHVTRTPAILDALDTYGVKATFLMLGVSAERNPETARAVALRGHTIGSHTYGHVDLTTLTRQAGLDEIAQGERAVARALAGAGGGVSPFFRFPYLSQTTVLRTSVMQGDVVVLDVDVDSKDYYREPPEVVLQRTLDRLDARGKGIILFHDIHQRTVDLLPGFLAELSARGYSVVTLKGREPGIFGRKVITAEVPGSGEES